MMGFIFNLWISVFCFGAAVAAFAMAVDIIADIVAGRKDDFGNLAFLSLCAWFMLSCAAGLILVIAAVWGYLE